MCSSDLSLVAQLQSRGAVTRASRLGGSRYALEIAVASPPEHLLPELAGQGVKIVSLQPLRDSLEDLFVREVANAGGRKGFERS